MNGPKLTAHVRLERNDRQLTKETQEVLGAIGFAHRPLSRCPPLLDILRTLKTVEKVVAEGLVKVEGDSGDYL